MKQLTALLLALALIFSLAGCITQDDLEEAEKAAYEKGYAEGYEVGEEAGYDDGYRAGRTSIVGFAKDDDDEKEEDSRPKSTTPSVTTGSSDMVYISRTGSKYHSNPYCSNMSNPDCVTLEEAIDMGRSPCKNCY